MWGFFTKRIEEKEIRKIQNQINQVNNRISKIYQVKINRLNDMKNQDFKDKWGVPYCYEYFYEEIYSSNLNINSKTDWEEIKGTQFTEDELAKFEIWKREVIRREMEFIQKEINQLDGQQEAFNYIIFLLNQFKIEGKYKYKEFSLDRFYDYID